jgi:hypothetical protein
MGHPYRMLTDRELKNFDRFRSLRENDRAFDSAIQHYYPNGIPAAAFSVEGAFDSKPARDEDPAPIPASDEEKEDRAMSRWSGALQTLGPLAKIMSAEDWADLQQQAVDCFYGKQSSAEDEPAPFPGRPRPGGRMDAMDRALAFDRKQKSTTSTPASFDKMYGNTSAKPSDSTVAKSLKQMIESVGTDRWPGMGRTRG